MQLSKPINTWQFWSYLKIFSVQNIDGTNFPFAEGVSIGTKLYELNGETTFILLTSQKARGQIYGQMT